jgi:hypothetical protein
MKILYTINKHLILSFNEHIWKPRCSHYKTWLTTKPTSYKKFCIYKKKAMKNKTTSKRKRRKKITTNTSTNATQNTPNSDNIPALNGTQLIALTQPKQDHKGRTMIADKDKKTWTLSILHRHLTDRINNGVRVTWAYYKDKIKAIIKGRKSSESNLSGDHTGSTAVNK